MIRSPGAAGFESRPAPVASHRLTHAVAASKAWMAEHPGQGIPFEDLLSDFGVTAEELRRSQDAA